MTTHPDAATPRPGGGLISLDEAQALLWARATPLAAIERVPLLHADGRVLAEDLRARLNVPPLDNAAMDGYAVRAAEAVAGAVLPVSQRIAAGQAGQPLAVGTAARIFTGAPLPSGADAVLMQEDTQPAGDGQVRVDRAAHAGQHIRRAGEDLARGALVLQDGELLSPAALGLAASLGVDTVALRARPRVALLCTGDELVAPGTLPPEALPPGAIYDSNRFFLHALLQRAGCVVSDLGRVPDSRAATEQALHAAAAAHDLVLTNGGVSVGEEDHVKPAVQALGALQLWQIAIKPGKPFAHGQLRRDDGSAAHFIGLPGNPVSSFVTFVLLVRPFLLRLQGARDAVPRPLRLRADFDWPRPGKRREFLRVRRNAAGGLDLHPQQGSGVLSSVHWADGLVDVAAGTPIAAGDSVTCWPLAEAGAA